MPQLDANTFLIQYTSVSCVLVILYILLSFGILPLILRALLIRARLLSTNFLSSHQPVSHQLINIPKLGLVKNLFVTTIMRESTFLAYMNQLSDVLVNTTTTNLLLGAQPVLTKNFGSIDFFTAYLVIFLITEELVSVE